MPKTSKKTNAAPADAVIPEYEALMETNDENLTAFIKANESMMEGMATFTRELVEFGNKRLRNDVELSETLMRCRTAEEAFKVSTDFTRRATEQYIEEASRLLDLASGLSRAYWTPLEDRTREALRNLANEVEESQGD